MSVINPKFGAKTTALEVIEGHDLTGKEAIVTGASSGIGVETVRVLAKAGARVVIATRNLVKAQAVAEQLCKELGTDRIEAEKLDLASLKSVHEFSKNFLAKNRPLHYLVNNAGLMACPLSYTEDGFEMQIGVNHFGHFALTMDLIPALKEGAKQSGKNARVVNLTSSFHAAADVNFEDIHFKDTSYLPLVGYGQASTANILFSCGLTKRFASDGIYSNAVMPGFILTELQRSIPLEIRKRTGLAKEDGSKNPNPEINKTEEEGAATTILACVAPELENRGGLYLNDCHIATPANSQEILDRVLNLENPDLVAKYAIDEANADQLWEISEKAIKQ